MPVTYADLSQPHDSVLYEKRNHVAYITLNRPDVGNALNRGMASIFRSIWEDIRQDPGVRCVILTGAGTRHFCTGADLGAAAAGGAARQQGSVREEVFWSARENNVWKPTICAVNGLVAGGGLHFVVGSDIIVAASDAVFMDTHVNVGIVGALENIGLARRLPLGTALRMTLQGRNFRLPARRAYELGLVDEITERENLMETAEQIAGDIIQASPRAVSLSLQAVWSSTELPYSQAVELGWSLLRLHRSHPDATEGPRAFAERRAPSWDDGVTEAGAGHGASGESAGR